jgi:hypothetical protein
MAELLHRIKIFVFAMREVAPDYLLLRSAGFESFWGPIQGPLGFGEKLESAIRREVMDEVGIARPVDLIDLQMPGRWLVGDEEIIEWNFGLRAHADQSVLSLAPRWVDYRWAQFSEAYPSLELDADRAAITRLHTLLHDAA